MFEIFLELCLFFFEYEMFELIICILLRFGCEIHVKTSNQPSELSPLQEFFFPLETIKCFVISLSTFLLIENHEKLIN